VFSLRPEQEGIPFIQTEKLLMTPLLNNTTLIKQVDAVCHLYGREAVADYHRTSAFKEIPEVPEKFRFGQRVKGTSGLIQDDNP